MDNPDSGIKLKIFYFSLEMSKEAKTYAAMSYLLFKKFGVMRSPQQLQSLFRDYILDKEVLDLLKSDEVQKWFKIFEEHVEMFDSIRHPYGLYNIVQTYAEAHGHYEYKTINWTNELKQVVQKDVKDKYIPDDPDEFVIVLTDHVSLLTPERGETLHQAMGKYSAEYCLKMRDRFGYTVVNVQQQSAASEAQQYTNNGASIVDKLKPTADGLGDNKLLGRDKLGDNKLMFVKVGKMYYLCILILKQIIWKNK